jgi:outer membrane immunogenic protein
VGGGLEFKLTPNWSLKGEYQYIDLSSSSAYGPVTLAGATVGTLHGNADVRFNTVRVGVNYYFATAYEPLPMK